MKLSLAFRHDTGRDLRLLIARVTGAPVHVALLFDDTCIEAAFSGVRVLRKDERLAKGTWTIVPVPMESSDVERVFEWASREVGAKYDWLGVLWAWWYGRFAGGGARLRWFCSELAADALRRGNIRLSRSRTAWYTPRRLYDEVKPWVA